MSYIYVFKTNDRFEHIRLTFCSGDTVKDVELAVQLQEVATSEDRSPLVTASLISLLRAAFWVQPTENEVYRSKREIDIRNEGNI